jgi:hypothetical protein
LARAKNTSRAEARKHTRDLHRAEMAELADEEQFDDTPEAETPAARPSLFKMPNIRQDLRELPAILGARRLIWLPFLLVLIGFIFAITYWGLPSNLHGFIAIYISFFFVPSGLFAYFIAGFVAPRASYLVGLLVGAFSGSLYGLADALVRPPDFPLSVGDAAGQIAYFTFNGAVLGTFAGGFAAWYRNFLRGMQKNGQQRRSDREAKERAKRRDQRQESRNVFKGRSG